jgi:protein phosphatase
VPLEVAQRTHPGLDPTKQANEDAAGHGSTPLGYLLVVCDGMGGHALGQEASQLAVSTILTAMRGVPAGLPTGPALVRAIMDAGRAVYQLGGDRPTPARPGSTCVAVLVHGASADVAHVGDSRVYLVRRGAAWPLTKDHSVVQELMDRGMLTPEQARDHPEANKITRALGMKADTEVDLREAVPCGADDVFVLATDGLCDLVRQEEIAAAIARVPTLEGACEELIRLANSRGGHDNITIQLARVTPVVAAGVGGAAGATLTDQEVAPTIVETPVARTMPAVVAPPMQGAPPAVAPSARRPTAEGPTARPARGGWVALLVGLLAMALILAGVMLWLIVRGPR